MGNQELKRENTQEKNQEVSTLYYRNGEYYIGATVQKQDENLDVVHHGLKSLKYELNQAEEGIDYIQKKIKKTTKKTDKSHKKLTTQTQRIKDLTNKLRSSDKLCCDIILILILLGLIGVLVAIIKQKY